MSPPSPDLVPGMASGEHEHAALWLDAFTRRASAHPARTAILSGERQVRYDELDEWSDRIARMLGDAGIGSRHYVGAGFHRGAELVAALLGILKSGAAYIPLDPSYPPARISRMLASARLEVVLSQEPYLGLFEGARVLSIEDATQPYEASDDAGPVDGDPIYAIFTSGSTGEPKAASVFHSGFANLLDWYGGELALGEDDTTLVISSPSFDLTQKNLFAPLLTGGRLVLDESRTYDITRILGLIRDHRVTLVNCTPSAFYPLVEASAASHFADLASLRFAVLGGEPISIPRLRAWLEHPQCRAEVVNSYGPTECTDICLFHRLHRGNLDAFGFVPLGREIPNVRVSIRNENLDPLPDGEIGELCITGEGIGGGYLHDAARTADRFAGIHSDVAHPVLYRTGDLARRLPCGTFEFRGRADHQVKVNGFRIELGEIELALGTHGSVREAVVTANGGKLTAHVRGDATAAELKAHLTNSLPAYMLPAEFRFVEKFPLTPNGKVDRKALADVRTETPGLSEDTGLSLEGRILSLWSAMLGRSVTDAGANFFDLGGNSIHLAVVHVRLREMTGRDFPITDLFAHTSARALAAHLSPREGTRVSSAVQDRARLAKSGFARFQRHLPR